MYEKTAKKYKALIVLYAFIGVIIALTTLFLQIHLLLQIIIALVLVFAIPVILLSLTVAKWITRTLTEEMDPEKYLFLSYATNMVSSDGMQSIDADLFRGEFHSVLGQIERKKSGKLNVKNYIYGIYECHCYFMLGEHERLMQQCETMEIMFRASKIGNAIRMSDGHIIEYFRAYLDGDYKRCKDILLPHMTDKKRTPIYRTMRKYYYALACECAGECSEANTYFAEVAEAGKLLYIGKMAKRHLDPDSAEQEEGIPGDMNSLFDVSVSEADLKRQSYYRTEASSRKRTKVLLIIAAIFFAVALIISLIPTLMEMSYITGEPYEVIEDNEDITRVIRIIPVNDEGDAICLYLADDYDIYYQGGLTGTGHYAQTLGIAYLDCVGENEYKFGISVRHDQAELRVNSDLYYFGVPDTATCHVFKVVEDKSLIPDDCISSYEFKIRDKHYYFCYVDEFFSTYGRYECDKV